MSPSLECVPNFSEGRRPKVVAAIADAMRVPGVQVLDASSDVDHNRSVITLAGEPDGLIEAMLAAAAVAKRAIDLAHHEGVHPRIGALDVCPFVPLAGTPMALAVETAERFAERLAGDHDIPAYLYAEAARRPERVVLADLRRGVLANPDFGSAPAHVSAGATAVGARFYLIAFNVELASNDVNLARSIARRVRERDGGLPAVRSLGLMLSERAQVSMNLVDYRQTGLHEALEAVSRFATDAGVAVHRSEIVGLVPQVALGPDAHRALELPEEAAFYWIEDRLAQA